MPLKGYTDGESVFIVAALVNLGSIIDNIGRFRCCRFLADFCRCPWFLRLVWGHTGIVADMSSIAMLENTHHHSVLAGCTHSLFTSRESLWTSDHGHDGAVLFGDVPVTVSENITPVIPRWSLAAAITRHFDTGTR